FYFSPRLSSPKQVECEGFYQGAHGVELQPGLDEIDAYFQSKTAELKKKSVGKQTKLDAALTHLSSTAPDVERLWDAAQARMGDKLPEIAIPLIVAGIGILAIAAEAELLAPAMDVLNVVNPTAQLIAALGLSGISALIFHFAWETVTDDAMHRAWK